jgi:hypothetical protein
MLLLATSLTYQMASFGPRRESANSFWPYLVASVLRGPQLVFVVGAFTLLGIAFLWPGLVEYFTTGKVYLHWSRLLAGAFSLLCAFQTSVFALLLKVLSVWRTQRDVLEDHRAAESANI